MCQKGYILSQKTREKMSKAKKGKHHSPETCEKIRLSHIGLGHSQETREKLSITHIGHIVSVDTREKIGKFNKGKVISQETREKIRDTNIGKHHSQETKDKIRLAQSGDKHSNWQGGISFAPYPIAFNLALKRRIRERDNYTCRICGAKENGKKHSVHHIDYNKDNCSDINLLTTCVSCNAKVNFNRKYWQKILSSGMFQDMKQGVFLL